MNMIASKLSAWNYAPTALFRQTRIRLDSHLPIRPLEQKEPTDYSELSHGPDLKSGTAYHPLEIDLSSPISLRSRKLQSKSTREILDLIDVDILRAAELEGGIKPQIEANRNQIADLLGLDEEWKRPDEVYGDAAWEICVIWRSGYGKVEIGTEPEGGIGYYVMRTMSTERKEGLFMEHNPAALKRAMSWLGTSPEEL